MKKFISLFLSFFLVLGAIFPTIAEASSKPVAVFYVPNQGDEQTVLGASILRHVKSNNVHVVLLTKPKNKQTFINDIKKMGVKQNQIHFANLNKSDTTIEKVKNIIQSYEKKYPNARHKTTSYISSDSVQYNAGVALLELHNSGKAKDARFYVDKADMKYAKKKLKEQVYGNDAKKVKNPINYYHKPNENKKPVAIFYVPHQDDELLTMGVAVVNHIESGNDVHLVLLTDGSASSALSTVNQKLKRDGYKTITRQQFSDVRDQEFKNSAIALGVQPSNIHYENLKDGNTHVKDIKNIIMKYEKKYPNARHKTMTYIDDHRDHRNAGQALLQLYNEGKVKDARFYIQDLHRVKGKKHWKENYKSSYYTKIKNAATSYMTYNPEKNQYAIGYTSVRGHFDNLLKNPVSYYHLPNF